MDKVELRARLDFWQSALSKLRAAYLALVDGGVKSYVIDDRELTRFDLPDLKDEIEDGQKASAHHTIFRQIQTASTAKR